MLFRLAAKIIKLRLSAQGFDGASNQKSDRATIP